MSSTTTQLETLRPVHLPSDATSEDFLGEIALQLAPWLKANDDWFRAQPDSYTFTREQLRLVDPWFLDGPQRWSCPASIEWAEDEDDDDVFIDEDDETSPLPRTEQRLSGKLYLLYFGTECCGRHGCCCVSCYVWEANDGSLHASNVEYAH
jgi:hypothetical protein